MSRSQEPRLLRSTLLVGLLVGGAAGALVTWVFSRPSESSATDVLSSAPASVAQLVCVGHVDVEEGVLPLAPLHPGRVIEILVRDSQPVAAGDVLLRQDDQPAQFQVRQAEAEVQIAEARFAQLRRLPSEHSADLQAQKAAIKVAQSHLDAATEALRRQKGLRAKELVSDSEVKIADAAVAEAMAALEVQQQKLRRLELVEPQQQLKQAEAEVAARSARLDEARRGLAECALRAPAAGTVLRVLAARGELVGGSGSQPALQFCPEQPRIVRAEVTQEFANRITIGQACLLQDEEQLAETWHGQLIRLSEWFTQRRSILQEPLQRNDVRTLECVVRLEPGQRPLRIGQRMRVTILK